MRIRVALLSLALTVVLAATAAGQTGADSAGTPSSPPQLSADQPWRILIYPLGDPNVPDHINDSIRAGYVPVGLEITVGESLAVLVARSEAVQVRGWVIVDYDDWNTLEAEITAAIERGMVPMDISRYSEVLAVLWVDMDLTIEGWRISTSPNTIGERTRTINDFQGRGFTLWGMSIHDNLAWYLFVRQPGVPPAAAVSGFPKDARALQAGMVGASNEGWAPNGLASTDQTVYVCFVR